MKKNVCVLVADGSEEMEVVIVVDVLRRAGIGTKVGKTVFCMHFVETQNAPSEPGHGDQPRCGDTAPRVLT